MAETQDNDRGQKLLSAVERILADTETITGLVDDLVRRHPQHDSSDPTDKDLVVHTVGRELVRIYSNRSAISGGAAAVPALMPGLGTLAAVAGGVLVDMALMLKFEVEMVLALSWLHGFDIRTDRERQLAFLLAGVSTYEARSGRNYFVDLADAEAQAVWTYAPREAGKALVSVFAKLAVLTIGKGMARALPLIGIGVGAGMNKVLTTRVGERAVGELARRRRVSDFAGTDDPNVVDAEVRKPSAKPAEPSPAPVGEPPAAEEPDVVDAEIRDQEPEAAPEVIDAEIGDPETPAPESTQDDGTGDVDGEEDPS